MDLEPIFEINLVDYLRDFEGLKFNGNNLAHCPFHEDTEPSFHVDQKNSAWLFHCFGCGAKGNLIHFFMKKYEVPKGEAIRLIKEKFNLASPRPQKEAEYIYRDESSKELFRIIRYRPKTFRANKKMSGVRRVLYLLPAVVKAEEVWLVEGEKDADNLHKLGLVATTSPFGVSNWKPEFSSMLKDKKVRICLDIGAEKEAGKRAASILKAGAEEVKIIQLPGLEKAGDDVSDWIALHDSKTNEELWEWLESIVKEAPVFQLRTEEKRKGIFVGTFEDFMNQEIREEEILVQDIAFRGALTGIGGVKGSHKSFFVNQLAFHAASKKSPFLKFGIEHCSRVLLIQQEVSLGFNKTRLKKMQESGSFKTNGGFYPITTTAKPLKLTEQKDRDQIRKWIDQYQPDILILDPLSSFNLADENTSRDMSKIVNIFSEFKSEFDLALVFTHHFSSKLNPGDPAAPSEAGGWFRGHSSLPDACDVLICLHRFPGQRENLNLPRDYEDYNLLQIQLRNGKWPERFAIEFHGESFLMHESSIWQELGKKIIPGEIEDLLEENGGEMLRADLIDILGRKAGITIIKKAIRETLTNGTVEKETIKAKGNPVMLRLKQ